MRWRYLALLLLLAGCAGQKPQESKVKTAAEDYISTFGPHYGWGDIYLGDTRQAVEWKLGKSLLVVPDGYPACGDFTSNIDYLGYAVSLQWSSDDPEKARVEAVSVDLPQKEMRPQEEIAKHIQGSYPAFQVLHKDEDSIELVSQDGQAVLIKNHREHFLSVTYGACID